jgi:hypothetical protein
MREHCRSEYQDCAFSILDGIAKEADNTGHHAAKTGHTRDNTPDYDKLSR